MTEQKAETLSRHPKVKYVEENAQMYSSGTLPTHVDPKVCVDPESGNCDSTVDNRMWHLDRIDQNSSSLTKNFSYCQTGNDVTVYVVDGGVNAAHQEFVAASTQPSRVKVGYNATREPLHKRWWWTPSVLAALHKAH